MLRDELERDARRYRSRRGDWHLSPDLDRDRFDSEYVDHHSPDDYFARSHGSSHGGGRDRFSYDAL